MTHLLNSDARRIPLADGCVQTVVTSPPYWGLRKYSGDMVQVFGGVDGCAHEWGELLPEHHPGQVPDKKFGNNTARMDGQTAGAGCYCRLCGAWRGDLGLEPTPDMFVEHIVEIFREVKRVLRDDGLVFLNLGDSYASSWASGRRSVIGNPSRTNRRIAMGDGLKEKDLCGIPWAVAKALQAPYIVPTCVRSEIDRSWLAALFDGDGCIGIRRFDSYRKEKQQEYQDGFVVYTVVTNNDTPLLDRCIEITGRGKVALKSKAGTKDKRAVVSRHNSYGWRLDGNKAVDVIKAIYPYLIAKRKQACLAYTLDLLNKSGHGSRSVPAEIQEKKVYLKKLINMCNQREEIDLPSWIEEPKQEVQPGWYLRSDIIWSKPNPMPESLSGWRWEQHRVKVGSKPGIFRGTGYMNQDDTPSNSEHNAEYIQPVWNDCPGCAVCLPNDGLVLRRGSWRPTKSHEYLFMLAKSDRYFADADAVREEHQSPIISKRTWGNKYDELKNTRGERSTPAGIMNPAGRNRRSVWQVDDKLNEFLKYAEAQGVDVISLIDAFNSGQSEKKDVWNIATAPYSGAHFATFPPALVEPCIKAGTSERGCCPACGASWARVVEKEYGEDHSSTKHIAGGDRTIGQGWEGAQRRATVTVNTKGWIQTCDCKCEKCGGSGYQRGTPNPPYDEGWEECDNCEPVPSLVLDPFCGSGTTLLVARALGRRSVGTDLSFEYLRDNARKRLGLDKLAAWQNGGQAEVETRLEGLPMFEDKCKRLCLHRETMCAKRIR